MLCRVADNLFWMSRYVERAVAVSRLIDVTWHLELDAGRLAGVEDFWAPLMEPGFAGRLRAGDATSPPTPQVVRHHLAFDESNPNALVACIRQARNAARSVRESISSELWEQLNTLYLSLVDPQLAVEAEESPHTFYRRVRDGAMFFQGLVECTLAQDEAYHFIELGKYLERADNTARILNLQAHLLTLPDEGFGQGPAGAEVVAWLAVLRSVGAAEAYARYYSVRVEPARVVEFLLLNPIVPQSVRFAVNAAWRSLQAVAGPEIGPSANPSPALRALGRLRARLDHAGVDEVFEEGLRPFLEDIQERIALVSEGVTRTYLRDEPQPGRLVALSRAALIMAAQQQQQ